MSPAASSPEEKARAQIDAALVAAGWVVQDRDAMNLSAERGVAVRAFKLTTGHGFADYLLFVDGKAVGVLEAKPEGHTLSGVEVQAEKYSTGCPTMAQQQADALALLAEMALHHKLDPGAPGERYQVVVHVDAAALADPDQPGQSVLEDGARVSAETSRRLACDASRVVIRHDGDGRTVEVGARTRTIPPALRRALHHRDRGCRFPGCGLPFGQGHHVRHWAQGGPTTLSNLALLCRRHHRAVHEEGYQVDRNADGVLQFRRPDGRLLPEVPPSATVPSDPVQALRARHDTQGLRLNARTACPSWLGERLDVGWAIDVLHPLATHEARPRGVQVEVAPLP